MTKDEALKLALEALQNPWKAGPDGVAEAITAIKEALAQPEPWEKFCDSNCVWTDHHPDCKLAERLPLTDEKIGDLLNPFPKHASEWGYGDFYQFARAIEAAHGIKGEA